MKKSYLFPICSSLSVFASVVAQSDDRPNILWIVSEDNTLYAGCYGDETATTPNIDRLAAEGILYENAYCTAPVSAPSRSSLITGMFPPSIGTQHMRSQNDMPGFLCFYPEYLRKAGYYCANNSKEDYNTSYSSKNAWDESSKKAEYKNRKPGQPFFQIYNTELSHESQLFKHPEKLRHDPTKVILPPYLPDLPETRYDRALYYDRLEDMDAFVGKILKQLEDDGLVENTIVFYYGDNGGVLGRSKRFVYESGLRVPLIVRFPEKYRHLAPAPAGSRVDRLVSFVDFAPTILSLTGLNIPGYMQGVPFLGEKAVKEEPKYIYAFRDRMDERYDMCRVVRGKQYKYIRNYMPHRIHGQYITSLWNASGMKAWERAYKEGKCDINQSRFWQTKPAEELYDIVNDPHEINNLASSKEHTSILKEMREAHKKWELNIFDTGFIPEAELKSRVAAEKTTPYDFIRNEKFPYKRVVETAQPATMGNPKDFNEIAKRLNDKEAVVRYWAAVGCCIQPKSAKSQKEKLFQIANFDPSPSTQIAAMEALFKIGYQNEALTLMRDLVINNTDDFVRLLALNAIDTFGSAADGIRKEIAATYPNEKFVQSEKSFYSPRIIDYWRETIHLIKNDSITYPIPNPLIDENGTEIKTVQQWEDIRRPELYKLFEQQVYGEIPEGINVRFKEIYNSSDYLQGKATIREFKMLVNNEVVPSMHILFFIPNGMAGKVPAIMGYNWNGNQALCTDTSVYMMTREQIGKRTVPRRLDDILKRSARGVDNSIPIEQIIDCGYAYITACYWELEPDNNDTHSVGIRALVNKGKPLAANQWGTIAAWAWGMSRMLDCAELVKEIDVARCALTGHSRLGKTALWAGASDKRFAVVTSNDSGCGGASLSKRVSGETVEAINTRFPYWFCENFHRYNGKVNELPIDQHELLALMAPRPLYVCSGIKDVWADPLGEYLSVVYAGPVYQLYGKQSMPYTENSLPPVNTPQIGDIAYHVEDAGHQFGDYDWKQFLLFFDKYLKTSEKNIIITQPHPRLLLLQGEEEQIKAKIRENELLKEAHDYIIKRCNEIINEPFVERALTGRKLLSKSRKALEHIYYLAYAWRMTGNDRYAARAEKEMLNVSNFKDWNPAHFLDVAEMTFALSIGYDWLHGYLPESTKKIVRKAIVEKGLNESMPETATKKENYSWLKKVNNWNQVCNMGMAFGAMVTYNYNPELSSKIILRSIESVRDEGMHEYLPDGNYPEGYTYWSYGTSFNVMLIDALEKCVGSSFGMTDNQGFMKTGDYILNMTTQNLGCFAYSDCGEVIMSFPMFWLAKRTNNPDLLWGELQKYNFMKKKGITEKAFNVRFLPSFLLWASPETMKNPQPPTRRLYVGQGTTPVALLRNHWGGKDEIFVGLKGGSCSTNHAHMDIGSFVMYRGANQWAKDAGIQEYYSLEKHGLTLTRQQNSSRWNAFRFGNKIHNLIIFSDSPQRVNAKAYIDNYGDTGDLIFAETDLTSVNKGLVKEYKRRVAIAENRYVVVRDEITNIDKTNPIRWAMFTPATPKIIDKNTAELTLNGEKLIVKVIGKEVELQTWSTKPPNIYDAPNPGTVLFGFTCKLAPDEKASIEVLLIPERLEP